MIYIIVVLAVGLLSFVGEQKISGFQEGKLPQYPYAQLEQGFWLVVMTTGNGMDAGGTGATAYATARRILHMRDTNGGPLYNRKFALFKL